MSDRAFERAVLDWLEDGSDRTPRPAIDAVLFAIKTAPQERDRWIPRRFGSMTQSFRLLAGAAALFALAVVGATILGPRSGNNIGGQPSAAPTVSPEPSASAPTGARPSPTPRSFACSLVSDEEAATAAEFPDVGARAVEDGTGCRYLNSLSPIFDLTYLQPGGRVAFQTAKGASGVQVLSGIGTDAIFDPATGTLTLAKGDAMVTIITRTPSQAPAAPIVAIAKLIAARI